MHHHHHYRRSWSNLRRNLTSGIPLTSFFYNAFLLINLLHYSTLPSLKIWSWPKTFAANNAEDSYTGWFTLEALIQAFSLLGSVYLFTAVLVSIAGFIGVLKKQPATIRFYRDCAIADLSFSTVVVLMMGYGAFFFQQLGLGVSTCDELSRNPVIMRSLSIDLENCEQAVERWLLASINYLVVSAVIRLHCILLISKFYNLIINEEERRRLPLNMTDISSSSRAKDESRRHHHHRRNSSSSKRVFIVEHQSSSTAPNDENRVMVYAPTSMTLSEARQLTSVKEAVVSRGGSGSSRRHHHRRRSSMAKEDTWVNSDEEDEGGIALPIYSDEPLAQRRL